MEWFPASTDIDPIEIMWFIIKRDAYENGKQKLKKSLGSNKIRCK